MTGDSAVITKPSPGAEPSHWGGASPGRDHDVADAHANLELPQQVRLQLEQRAVGFALRRGRVDHIGAAEVGAVALVAGAEADEHHARRLLGACSNQLI